MCPNIHNTICMRIIKKIYDYSFWTVFFILIVTAVRDFDAIMVANVNFDIHIRSAGLILNTICPFYHKEKELCAKLCNSIVFPKYLFCCEVWHTYLTRRTKRAKAAQAKFTAGISLKCDISWEVLRWILKFEVQIACDTQRTLGNDVGHYFHINENKLQGRLNKIGSSFLRVAR